MGASESKVAPMQVPVPQAKVIVAPAPVKKGKSKATNSGAGSTAAAGANTETPAPLKQNDYELAIRSCKELEFLLETEFGSTGATLHERITNSNASLPIELISKSFHGDRPGLFPLFWKDMYQALDSYLIFTFLRKMNSEHALCRHHWKQFDSREIV